jgi:outer membrane murein-binding lipoprotein Lpp
MRRHRTTALVSGVALAAALTLTGCGALDKARDCVQAADAIATSVDRLSQAVSNAGDPTQIEESLNAIDKELTALKDKTGNADLSKAVDDLANGVEQVRTSVKNGDTTPDLKPVTDAATEVGKVCTP